MNRKEAQTLRQVTYDSDTPCKRGHVGKHRTKNGSCINCEQINRQQNYVNVRDKHVTYMKSYYRLHKPKLNQQSRQYYQTHQEALRASQQSRYKKLRDYYLKYNQQYYQKNVEYFRRHQQKFYQENIDYYVEYWQTNAAKYNSNSAKRRAALKQAIPRWADLDAIQMMYQECKLLCDSTGIPHEVDHIVPLQSDVVCGLHCVDNLQILSRFENRRKSNHV